MWESEEMVERQLVAWSKERCVDVRGQVLWSRFVWQRVGVWRLGCLVVLG